LRASGGGSSGEVRERPGRLLRVSCAARVVRTRTSGPRSSGCHLCAASSGPAPAAAPQRTQFHGSSSGHDHNARADFAGQLAAIGRLPAYRASLDRAGLANPADTLVIGDEATVTDAVKRYQDAGVTDLIVVPLNERSRTLDLLVSGG
jgi:hypothetical protein